MKSTKKKVEKLAEWLHEDSVSTCQDCGGYPDEVRIVGDSFLVVAGVDDDEPTLSAWTLDTAAQWHDDIIAFRRDYPDELALAVSETRPEEDA